MDYEQKFLQLLDSEDYHIFKENYLSVAQALDDLVTSTINETQLDDLETEASAEDTRKVMDIYDDLGVISSKEERKTVQGEGRTEVTVYRMGRMHGKGFSKSWEEITQKLEDAMQQAEREHCWQALDETRTEEYE